MELFRYNKPFELESGEVLPSLDIAYHTYGTLSDKKDNCIWVCHALTADSDVKGWWPHTVEKGRFLDPEKYFIVCANIIGSCYGSTGPLSTNEKTGEPWYDKFPRLTVRDIVRAHILLANHLGLDKIHSLIGSSVGGFQAIEWAVDQPDRFDSLVLIATDAIASPWAVALDETQRMAIFSDKTYGMPSPEAGQKGLAAARAIGLLSYRGPSGYNASQQNIIGSEEEMFPKHRAVTYQQYQGKKLIDRFNVYSYVVILDMFDTHNVGRDRGGIDNALKRLNMPVLNVGITTDLIFSPQEIRTLTDKIPGAVYQEIESAFGHDGFLVEHEKLNKLIQEFFNNIKTN